MVFALPEGGESQTRSLIGVLLAISGNVLISLALNLQKQAHNQLQRQVPKVFVATPSRASHSTPGHTATVPRTNPELLAFEEQQSESVPWPTLHNAHSEAEGQHSDFCPHDIIDATGGSELSVHSPLLPQRSTSDLMLRHPLAAHSGCPSPPPTFTDSPPSLVAEPPKSKSKPKLRHPRRLNTAVGVPDDFQGHPSPATATETAYLRSKQWWIGMALMVSGETGNFLAYGFAPASVVAPLGTVTLITNVFMAPLLLKETVRVRDACGVLLAILGAFVVVSSSKSTDPSLTPDKLWDNITSFASALYYLVTLCLMSVLAVLSPHWGSRLILVDLGLVALSGGYTVLATKGLSSLLQLELILVFKYPITYLLLMVLLYSAVVQIKYLNRALQRFDSTQVIPTQFVAFTLSAIVGSAVIYRDFEHVLLRDAVTFILGCGLTFWGVFLITSNRPKLVPLPSPSISATLSPTAGPVSARALENLDMLAPWSVAPRSAAASITNSRRSSVHDPGLQSADMDALWALVHRNSASLDHPTRPRCTDEASSGPTGLPQTLRSKYWEMAQRLRSNSRSIIDHAAQYQGVFNPTLMALSTTQESEAERRPSGTYRTFGHGRSLTPQAPGLGRNSVSQTVTPRASTATTASPWPWSASAQADVSRPESPPGSPSPASAGQQGPDAFPARPWTYLEPLPRSSPVDTAVTQLEPHPFGSHSDSNGGRLLDRPGASTASPYYDSRGQVSGNTDDDDGGLNAYSTDPYGYRDRRVSLQTLGPKRRSSNVGLELDAGSDATDDEEDRHPHAGNR
ncbi:hypothetical protein H4R34_002062 [Dimargaris verticillata]|uniref:Magnesium transporter NIPA-domain-containing protein n=1 Tax=Dimargaris verticillata TaxID=2761393 RepID=A0A9W8E9N6_9FUNG|nr:hypothetical protein H4R34_002062 [Dimargaris verticillata]